MTLTKKLNDEQRARYQRQMMLDEIGEGGQAKLGNASVLLVGAGGLGSAASFYLVAAGVGKVGIIDSDVVELSNLQRQILHGTQDVGRLKVDSAAATLFGCNPHVQIETTNIRVDESNADSLMEKYDIVVDAADNFGTKFVINDACVRMGKSFVHAGVTGYVGQVFSHRPGTACMRCVFPVVDEEQAKPAGLGILGAAAGCIGTMEAVEVIKLILDIGTPLENRIRSFDLLGMRSHEVSVKKDDNCPVCREKQ